MNIFITCSLGGSIWSDSTIQSAITLYESINCEDFNVFYLNSGKVYDHKKKNHKFYNREDLGNTNFPHIDIMVLHQFGLTEKELNIIKKRNPNCKFILYEFRNVIAFHQDKLIKGMMLDERIDYLDEIWIPEHHSGSLSYMKSYHHGAKVRCVPYLWSSFYINVLSRQKEMRFNSKNAARVVILEQNKNHAKNCLIPLLACEDMESKSPTAFNAYSVMNTQKIKSSSESMRFIESLKINQRKKLYLNSNWKTPDIFSKLGQYVLSHQENNTLNYLYLEALYLGLPLIHNSEYLKSYGYFYNGNDVSNASNQLLNAKMNHIENYDVYMQQNNFLIKEFDPQNPKNKSHFKRIITEK